MIDEIVLLVAYHKYILKVSLSNKNIFFIGNINFTIQNFLIHGNTSLPKLCVTWGQRQNLCRFEKFFKEWTYSYPHILSLYITSSNRPLIYKIGINSCM